MYAIVRTGGKQYRVEEGRTVTVERLPAGEGETVELGDVLLIADDGQVEVGAPVIEGARVLAEVEARGRGPKVVVFKYKAKVRTRKKTGHRQSFTRLAVREILRAGETSKMDKPKRSRRRKAEEAAPEEAPPAEAKPKPARRRAAPKAAAAPAARRSTRTAKPKASTKATGAKPTRRPRAKRTSSKAKKTE